MKKLFFTTTTLITILFFLFFIKSVRIDYNESFPEKKRFEIGKVFEIKNELANIDAANIKEEFPYNQYLQSDNYHSYNQVKEDATAFDKCFKDQVLNRKILIIALTDSLFNKTKDKYLAGNIDSLYYLSNWVQQFENYKNEENVHNEIMFQTIHNYWIGVLVNKLKESEIINPDIKFNFKYKFLREICSQNNFHIDYSKSQAQKVLDMLFNNNWNHLIQASYNSSSKTQKIIIVLVFLLTLYTYLYTINRLFLKIKSK